MVIFQDALWCASWLWLSNVWEQETVSRRLNFCEDTHTLIQCVSQLVQRWWPLQIASKKYCWRFSEFFSVSSHMKQDDKWMSGVLLKPRTSCWSDQTFKKTHRYIFCSTVWPNVGLRIFFQNLSPNPALISYALSCGIIFNYGSYRGPLNRTRLLHRYKQLNNSFTSL